MITKERIEQIYANWLAESEEIDAEEWREALTREEAALVDQWDHAYEVGIARMARDILARETERGRHG